MSVKGKVREQKEWIKETGVAEVEVVAINPDREALEKLMPNANFKKDPEYLGEDEKGKAKLQVDIWVKVIDSDKYKCIKFFLKDVHVHSEKKNKDKFINGVGKVAWAETADTLPDWLTEIPPIRKAHDGEEELYNFVHSWLGKLDTNDAESALDLDWKKLMRGNISELNSLAKSEYVTTFGVLVTVKTVDKDGEVKQYEEIYNRAFLPGYAVNQLNLKKISQAFIDKARETKKENERLPKGKKVKLSALQNFVLKVTDPENGCKHFFTLGKLQEYNPKANMVESDVTMVTEEEEHDNDGEATRY